MYCSDKRSLYPDNGYRERLPVELLLHLYCSIFVVSLHIAFKNYFLSLDSNQNDKSMWPVTPLIFQPGTTTFDTIGHPAGRPTVVIQRPSPDSPEESYVDSTRKR